MGLSSARESIASGLGSLSNQQSEKKVGWVYDIILDENNQYAKDKKFGASVIGSIRFRTADNTSPNEADLPIAHPFDKNFIKLPVKNELVEIYTVEGSYYYRRIGQEPNPSQSAAENAISSYFSPKPQQEQKAQNYQSVSATGISRTNQDKSKEYDGYGKYYKNQSGIHKLKLYEGDTLFESRFGQSIRFSGYNNAENKFSPTVIIRNNESAQNKKKDVLASIEEDVNKDGSVIAIGSDQYQLAFQPGTVDDGGSSDVETKPNTFKSYPSKLIGDQILINSGRIILSAKNAEMIFYSKKNYGFISDGSLSIDNKLGIDVNVGDVTNITTNDRDINLNTGNGKINLGNKQLEPLVKGDALVDILTQLIDAITQQVYLTPSGPSATGPTNLPTFNSIKSKLKTILSELNSTS